MDWIEIMDLCYCGLVDYKRSDLLELAEQQNQEIIENGGVPEFVKNGWDRNSLQKCISEQAEKLQNLELESV